MTGRVVLGYSVPYEKSVRYRTWLFRNIKEKEDYSILVDLNGRTVIDFVNKEDAVAFKLRFNL